ncbi:MAG: aminotransferase class IV [Candidatus Omnitrophica bacterium]|nr:aminotransferase class IV [Candidatus Omnitrophota bacterium]
MKVFLNNQLYEKEDINEILEPGYLFGWGAFETMRAWDGKIPHLKSHLARLEEALRVLGLDAVVLEWEKEITRLLDENGLARGDAYIRITVYKKRKSTGVIMYTDTFGYYPPEVYDTGFKAVISPYRRYEHSGLRAVKSLSYGYNRLSWLYAQQHKKDEALVVSVRGDIVGGARSNLFLIRDGTVYIPGEDASVFTGITAQEICTIIKTLGVPVKEKKIGQDDIARCDEAFLTSSLLYVMPLVEWEGRPISSGRPGELSRQILKNYRENIYG